MLFTSWLFFNAGSRISNQNVNTNMVRQELINTIISSASAVCCITIFDMFHTATRKNSQNVTLKFDLVTVIDSIMAGCVSITASCDMVSFEEAIVIGFVGALIYKYGVVLFQRLEIDDPLNVSQVHGLCGLWGLLATGLFDKDKGLFHSGSVDFLGI